MSNVGKIIGRTTAYEVISTRETEKCRGHVDQCLYKRIPIIESSAVKTNSSAMLLTSAISILIPFGLFLNVGGNNESKAKLTVCPEAAAPSRVTVKTLLVFEALLVGLSVSAICFQVVWEPLMVVDA